MGRHLKLYNTLRTDGQNVCITKMRPIPLLPEPNYSMQLTNIYANKVKSINQYQIPWAETGRQILNSVGLKPLSDNIV